MPTIKELLNTMEYGPSPEATEHVMGWLSERGRFGHFIDGHFKDGQGHFDVVNPATGAVLAEVAQGEAEDVDAAVAAARAAFPDWAALPGHDRARYLYALARHIQKRERFLTVLESLDNGKPIRESRDIDVPLVARHFYHHAGWAELLEEHFPGRGALGVCGQIIPWNFPLLMLAWKVAPALAAGNTVVLKPAEDTPLTALAFAEICQEVGLPNGVVNIVTGDGETGAALVAHKDVDKIAFTGSTEVGRQIRRTTAGTGKRLTLELGGKSPFIVFADADLDAAVEGVVDAIWFNQGQVCCAGSRILVQAGVAEVFAAKLKARMKTLRLGDPLDKSTDVGAIINPTQLGRIRRLIVEGQAQGAVLHQAEASLPSTGCFFAPAVLTGVAPANVLATEEIFGPVATLTTFRTPEEAVELANATRYGLSASIWSENVNLCLDVAAQVKAGVVWINATNLFDAGAGFGGYRESGFGREGGAEGMEAYLGDKPYEVTTEPAPRPLETFPFLGNIGAKDIDRTAKLYIGGTQKRSDSGYSYNVISHDGTSLGEAGLGSRKDIRNAVEAAQKASGWGRTTGHTRAQVLYYLAENLSARRAEFQTRLNSMTGDEAAARAEVETAIRRTFWYAAWADKFDGRLHATKSDHVTLALHEPFGVMGIVCPTDAPLLGFLSLILPAIAMGNRVVAVPSQNAPLMATDLYQVFDTSDIPSGVINIVTGDRDELAQTLALHDDVAAMWYFGSAEGSRLVEEASAGNLKVTWVNHGRGRDWQAEGQGRAFLQQATQIKNVWVPYGA